MKLPNWFKIAWWAALLLCLSYAIYIRFPFFKSGDTTLLDSLVLIIWFALALVPIFKEIKLPGVNLSQGEEPLTNQKDQSVKNSEVVSIRTSSSISKEALKKFNSKLLIEQEKKIEEEINECKFSSRDEKDQFLYRALASSQIAVTFEKTYFTIYGSQLKALQHLNGNFGAVVNISDLRRFYEEARLQYPKFYATYSFEGWLNFLNYSVLISQTGDKVGISVRGQEFLKYIIDQMYSFNKAG